MTGIRRYEEARDADAIRNIWNEIGWLDPESKAHQELAPKFYALGPAWVADVHGQAEAVALTCPGTFRHLEEELPFGAVSGVTTGLAGRKQGLATRLTARAVATVAEEGALVSGLGMFDQGFYDRLGFGAGPYDYFVQFDPANLSVPVKARAPHRFTKDDWEGMHAARLVRKRGHGAVSLTPAAFTRCEMAWSKGGRGLGYRDDGGRITHGFWYEARRHDFGPVEIAFMVYRDGHDLLELFDLMRHMGEAVRTIKLVEPGGFQVQDLLKDPGRTLQTRGDSKYPVKNEANAWWQIRINDVPRVLERTHLPAGRGLRFNLEVADPIEGHLDSDVPWRGAGGAFVVTLGEPCEAKPGSDPALPTLTASINAFSRLWLGTRPASGLALTRGLDGPQELLKQLDKAFCLPHPCPEGMY